MTDIIRATKERLCRMCDLNYREFQTSLIPNIPKEQIIGVRVPALRTMAKQMLRDGSGIQYLQSCSLPHETYDENNLHAFLLEGLTDFDDCMAELERFLPYVNNWATCDMMVPPILKTQPTRLLAAIRVWLTSNDEFTVRYGLVMLMRHYLGAQFTPEILTLAASVKHDGYYVKMAAAWLFAEALAMRWDDTNPFLVREELPLWTRKKAIQKALESHRLTDEQKIRLRMLREELKT